MPTTFRPINGPNVRGNCFIDYGVEGDNQTFKQNDFLTQTSGKLVIARTGDGNVDSTTAIAGLSRSDGRNTTNPGQPLSGEVNNLGSAPVEDCPILKPEDDLEILLPFYAAGGGASAEYQDATKGLQCVLGYYGGIWGAVIGTTANANLQLVEKLPFQPGGNTEQYAFGWFRILSAGRLIK